VVAARKILEQLGVQLHPRKTRIVHVQNGFEFLGYKITRGRGQLRLAPEQIRSGLKAGALYAYPREKSIRRFMDQVRAHETAYTAADQGADCRAEPALAGVGQLLQANPCPQALPPTRRLD